MRPVDKPHKEDVSPEDMRKIRKMVNSFDPKSLLDDQDPPEQQRREAQVNRTAIIILVTMIVFGSLSSQGMLKWGCKNNWNFLVYALANFGNMIFVGIPGFLGFWLEKNTRFAVVSA